MFGMNRWRLALATVALIGVAACGGGSYAELSADDAVDVARDHLGIKAEADAIDVQLDEVDRHDCALVTFAEGERVVLSASDGRWAVMEWGPEPGTGYDPAGTNCLVEP